MAKINTSIITDENTYQLEFYKSIYGDDYLNYVSLDKSTDGYTDGIIFEHKKNVKSYGQSKALSQALIYLCRFNRDGVPVPKYTILVSQDEETCYVYDNQQYIKYINNVEMYSNLKASDGIPGFKAGKEHKIIKYNLNSAREMNELLEFVEKEPEYIKVDINEHNVYGWSSFYYDNATKFKQKPEKKKLFNELKNPVGTLKDYINAWKGKEIDFKYIMDMLNDPMTQKKLGAFYTPKEYCKLAKELVDKAIKRVPKGNDYVIIDRCAGGGNLEMYFSDTVLSHIIISTYELKEWMVLKDRFGTRVRYIIPPIPKDKNEHPKLNTDGFLSGANALTRDIIDNKEVKKYIDNPKCTIILFENVPYIETTNIEFQKKGEGKKQSDWKDTFVVKEMKKEVSGPATNDMGNAFIWSGFKYFLRQDTDSYIVFSPVKYWKAQHLINKKFIDGFAFNRKHFHAPTPACIMCALWSNEDDYKTDEIKIKAFDINNDRNIVEEGNLIVRKINSTYSDCYYDTRSFDDDTLDGIVCELDGTESHKSDSQIYVQRKYNKNILGYMVAQASGFDNNRLLSTLHIAGRYNAHGFFLRNDNYLEKLPIFAASRYTDNVNDWKIMSLIMKSGDKCKQYEKDIRNGKLNKFLCKCLIWTCLSQYPHTRSLKGSDNRFYKNELCFDGNTIATRDLNNFIKNGYKLSKKEKELFDKYNDILKMVRQKEKGKYKENYNSKYTYGLYQIDEEINLKDEIVDRNGNVKKQARYGDLNNAIKELKDLLRQYYISDIVDTLFKYEFLK